MIQEIVKIVDFGSAIYSIDMRATQIGSLPYLSPEQLKGEGYGREKDLWSIGIMTYELLFKEIPYHQSVILELFMSENKNTEFPDLKFPKFR